MGGATYVLRGQDVHDMISIHAPRGGSDSICAFTLSISGIISIHAPRGGSDSRPISTAWRKKAKFQSTLPVGGATIDNSHQSFDNDGFQSTLPVGGATIIRQANISANMISIHAPRGGSDSDLSPWLRRRCISIHAPRGGSDSPSKSK